MSFRFEKQGVWYIIFNGTFSVWHTRSKKHAEQVVEHSNALGALHIVALGGKP